MTVITLMSALYQNFARSPECYYNANNKLYVFSFCLPTAFRASRTMHSVVGTAHVKKGSCAIVNCGEQRDDKTNPYKSMKGGKDFILVQNPLVP